MTAGRQGANREAGRIRTGITVLGAGNWGSSLAAGVVAAGIPLLEVAVPGGRAPTPRDGRVVSWTEATFDAEILWICVPDGEIAGTAGRIAARRGDLRGQVVVHSSGALTMEALAAVRAAGAGVGGIAPVFSFPTREPIPLAGVLFAVESSLEAGPGSWRRLAALVRKLGGTPLRISSENKALYHAAATMASPLLVSALQAAVATAGLAGLKWCDAEAAVRALATVTLQNFFEKGTERSFSGAFARGDVATVALHLQALLAHPIQHEVYLALARNAVVSLPARNRRDFKRILRGDLPVPKRFVKD